jgi:hypothetical protein
MRVVAATWMRTHEKLIVAQIIKQLRLVVFGSSLPCWKAPTTTSYGHAVFLVPVFADVSV